MATDHPEPLSSMRLIEQIGRGTYGTVWKALIEDSCSRFVAVKRLNIERETQGFPQTSAREVKILQSLHHPNIIALESIAITSTFLTDHATTDVSAVGPILEMVFPYVEHDLAGLIGNPSIHITLPVAKFYLQQILLGLEYLHANRIVHRDIKSSNILISNTGAVQIADFGLARFTDIRNCEYTNRVVTLWYRSPELLMGEQHYDYAVDMWAAGCIMIELLTGSHPFPGTTEMEMLGRIFRLCGTPNSEDWPSFRRLPWYNYLKPKKSKTKRLFEIYQSLSPDALDLVNGLLCLDPSKRFSATEALGHPFLCTTPLPIRREQHPCFPHSHELKYHQLHLLGCKT